MKENESLSWTTLEYAEKNHSIDWYWTVGLVMLVVLIGCIYFKDYLFGFVLVIGVGSLVYLTFRKPETVSIEISAKGVQVKNELYPYRNLKAFWVEEEPQANGDRHLLILTNRVYLPLIALPLGDIAPETIRQGLLPHLKEEEMKENPSHKFLEILGF